MSKTTSHAEHSNWRRPFRYLWRVPMVVLLLIASVPAALFAQSGAQARAKDAHEPLGHRVVRAWTRAILWALGIRARGIGTPLPDPVMFVANHSSWLDIELLHTQRAACFVAKAEIARWPLVGWLAASAGTIFHHRGSTDSLSQVIAVMAERLRGGRAVAVFPEGGIGEHVGLRPFHARILQAALDAEAPLQPVALRYSRHGIAWPGVGFADGESFVGNIWRLLGEAPFDAEVHFLAVVSERDAGRKRMAETARTRIAAALDADGS